MAMRKRTIALKVYVSEREYAKLKDNMRLLGSSNFSAYARKMLCDGYVVHQDFDVLKEFLKPLGRIAQSLSSLARRANSTGNIYREDVLAIAGEYKEIKAMMVSSLNKIAKERNEGEI